MPAVSKKQQRFMGAELGRKRAGKKTKTKMTEKQLKEYASTPRKGLPEKKKGNPNDHSEENAKERMKMMGGKEMPKKKHKKMR